MIEWSFEHFKTFTPFEVMQQAAAALVLYERENTDGKNPKMSDLTETLIERTNHPAWMPVRETENYTFNQEGSVFRNKARLFSSFLICFPPALLAENEKEKEIQLTDFGRALGNGEISEKEYYDFIIMRFKYPHPAFSDYEEWIQSSKITHPFVLILKVMVELFERSGKVESKITVEEIVHFIQKSNDQTDITKIVDEILEFRTNNESLLKLESRKIREIMSFLTISGYVLHEGDTYALNLVRRHEYEKSFYYLERSAQGAGGGKKRYAENIIESIKNLWR